MVTKVREHKCKEVLKRNYLAHDEIVNGGVLVFEMTFNEYKYNVMVYLKLKFINCTLPDTFASQTDLPHQSW